MKTSRTTQPRRLAGSVLITTLLVALLLLTMLTSYLLMVRGQNVSVARSQAWHSALTVAEAGVEEALAQLNPGALTTHATITNSWVLEDGRYRTDPPERELLGGRYAVVYDPTIPPTIYSTGYVTMPVLGDTIVRVIQVQTTNAALYQAPLTAAKLDNPGNKKFETNSYDSSDQNYHTATNTGVAATAIGLPDVLPPFAIGLPLPGKTGSNYVLSVSGNYLVPGNFVLANDERFFVPNNLAATVYVQGDFSMTASSKLEIAPGGSLRMFVGGVNAMLGPIDNQGTTTNFQYFGLPGNTIIEFVGRTNSLVGTIYAPHANLTTTTRANTYFDFFGALTVDTFTLRRNFRLHFDENLRNQGPRRGFVATSWREL